jgi:hypothetical protein
MSPDTQRPAAMAGVATAARSAAVAAARSRLLRTAFGERVFIEIGLLSWHY